MRTSAFPREISTLAAKGTAFFTGLGARLLVHLSSLIAAAIITATITVPELGMAASSAIVACTYIGLVCLIPKGIGLTVSWLIPTGLGLVQCMLWTFWGIPWQATLLWGGALTWTTRLLVQKGDLGWEWTAVPWLLLAVYGFFSTIRPLIAGSIPLWTLPILALAGAGVVIAHTRRTFDPLHRKMLASACERLDGLLSLHTLPDALTDPVKLLCEQGRGFERVLPRMDASSAALISEIDAIASRLIRYDKASGPWLDETDLLLEEATSLNARLSDRLREFSAPQNALNQALAARIEEFQQSALSLMAKKQPLPPYLQAHIDGIAEATKHILTCMRTDPQDVVPAEKFLSRYLTAAHTVVDEYTRLSHQGKMHDAVAQALNRSGDLLERLEKAFVEEHGRLLQNDTVNFTAELNVLDKLLKMEGR